MGWIAHDAEKFLQHPALTPLLQSDAPLPELNQPFSLFILLASAACTSCLHPAAPAHIENHTCHQSDKHRLILKVLSFFNRYRRLWSLLKTTSVLFDQSSFLSMCALSYLYFSTTSASVPLTLTGERGGTLLSDRANKSLS